MFTKGQWITFVAIATVSMLLAVGCVAQQPAASTAAFPTVGRFKGTHPQYGEFEMEFQADGTLTITLPSSGHGTATNAPTRGTYAVTGNQVTIKGLTCEGADKESGTYTWVYDGKVLYFNVVADKCTDRLQVLPLAWAKQ